MSRTATHPAPAESAAAQSPAATDFTPAATGGQRRLALMVILLALFMDLLDNTIVNVALPPIQRELDATYSAVQWVVAGYALAFALGLITGGRLGDIYGRKRVFLVGVAGFTLTSALCGMAQTPGQLVAARVAQGAAAALMVPQVLSIIQVMYAPKDRAKAMAAFGGLAGLATVGGPILGAVLTEGDVAGLGWRLVFLVNIPVGVLALIAAAAVVPESRAERADRLDVPGVGLVTLGLLMLIYPLIRGRELDWPAWTFASIAGSLVVFGAFVAYQRRRTRSPLVELSLFRHRSFTGGLLVSLLFMGGVIGFFLVLTVYLQVGLGFSVLRSGLTGIPWGFAVPTFAGISVALLAPRLGRTVLQLGLGLVIAAMVGLMWTVRAGGAEVSSLSLAPALFLGGVGMGLCVALVFDFALAEVPVGAAGSASGLLNTVQQIGGAIGIAAIGALFFSLVPAGEAAVGAPGVGGGVPAEVRTAIVAEFSRDFATTLWFPVAMFAAALLATGLLPRRAPHHDPI
jgi:EmrB/QacA subfamily drug resistance transporter